MPPVDAPGKTESDTSNLTLRTRILLNSAVQFAGRVGSGIGALLLVGLLTRYLGQSGFGRYTFVTGYVSLFYVITDLGSGAVAVREIARRPDRAREWAGLLLGLKLFLSCGAAVFAAVIAFAGPDDPFGGNGIRFAILLAATALLLSPAFAAAGVVFQTSLRMTVPAVSDVVTRLVGLALVVLLTSGLILSHVGPDIRLCAVIVASTLSLAGGAVISFVGATRLVSLAPRFNRSEAWAMVKDAAPLAVVSVLGVIHYRVDVVILSAMRDMATVGTYGVATKLLDAFIAGSGLFMNVVFPIFSSRAFGERSLLQRAFQKAFDLMMIVGLGTAVFVTVFAPFVVRILGGAQFHSATTPLAVIAWAIPVIFAGSVLSHMVVAVNRQVRAVPIVLVAIALNIGLNIVLIPRMGATGPAAATVLSESVTALGVGMVMVRHYHFGPDIFTVIRIAACAAAAGLLSWLLLPSSAGPALLAGIVTYLGGLFLLRVVTVLDIQALISRRATPA